MRTSNPSPPAQMHHFRLKVGIRDAAGAAVEDVSQVFSRKVSKAFATSFLITGDG